MARKPIRTTILEIVDYWTGRTDESRLSVDFAEAHERCWRCGCQRQLERCHIVPDSLGGEDTPSNFVILCKRCHLDNPNVADPEVMWDWLRAYSVPLYDTFWWMNGLEEYKKIYGKSYVEELRARGVSLEDPEFKAILNGQWEKASCHFGDPHLNIATLAGIIRMALKAYDAAHGLETERNVTAYINRSGFWHGG